MGIPNHVAPVPPPAGAELSVRLFQDFLTCRVLIALDNLSFFECLEKQSTFTVPHLAAKMSTPAANLQAMIRYLVSVELVLQSGNTFELAPGVREDLTRGKGFMQWLVGAYGPVLNSLEELSLGRAVYGKDVLRNDREVARSSANIARVYTDPFIEELLRTKQIRTIADVGTGSAMRLVDLCKRLPGLRAIGLDISPACCDVARINVREAGLQDRIQIIESRAEQWLSKVHESGMWHIDLVLCCAMFHDLLNVEGLAETFLEEVISGLRPGAYVLIQDQLSQFESPPEEESWVPGFELVHHFMGQRLFHRSRYEEVFEGVGLELITRRSTPIPENFIYLLRVPLERSKSESVS